MQYNGYDIVENKNNEFEIIQRNGCCNGNDAMVGRTTSIDKAKESIDIRNLNHTELELLFLGEFTLEQLKHKKHIK